MTVSTNSAAFSFCQAVEVTGYLRTQVENLVMRRWCPELTASAAKVLVFILDRTIRWNRPTCAITNEHFMTGCGEHTGGTKLSLRTVQYAVKALIERGYIIRRGTDTGVYLYAINFMEALASMLPTRRNTNGGEKGTPERRAQPTEKGSGQVPHRRTRQEPGEGGATVAPPYREGKGTGRKVNLSAPAGGAAAGHKRAVDVLSDAVGRAQARIRERAARAGKGPTGEGLEASWSLAMGAVFPSATHIAWTIKTKGMAKQLAKRLGAEGPEFFAWVVEHWGSIVHRAVPWLKKRTGRPLFVPDVEVVLTYQRAFLGEFAARRNTMSLYADPDARELGRRINEKLDELGASKVAREHRPRDAMEAQILAIIEGTR